MYHEFDFRKMKKAARPATICPGKTNELITTISIINFGRKCSLSSVNILLFPASSGLTMAYIACGLLYGKWRYVYSSFCGNDEEGKGGDLPTALLVPNPSLEISSTLRRSLVAGSFPANSCLQNLPIITLMGWKPFDYLLTPNRTKKVFADVILKPLLSFTVYK